MGASDLGPLVTEHRRTAFELKVHERGVSLVQGQRRFSTRWLDLIRVHYQRTQVTVNGVPMPESCLLQFVDQAGKVYTIQTRDPAEAEKLEQVVRLSAPVLAKRDLAAFSAGQDLDLGAVRLSLHRLAIRKGARFKEVPLDQVAGWAVRNGHLMVDRNRSRPRMVSEVPIGQVGNLPSVLAILASVYPEGDLSDEHNRASSIARARRKPWHRPISATREPGGFSARGCFLVVGGVLALGVLFLLTALPFAIAKESFDDRVDESFASVVAVGRRVAGELGAVDPPDARSLAEVCEGRMEYGPADTLAAYLGPLPEPILSRFKRYDRDKPHRRVIASNEWGGILSEPDEREFFDSHNLLSAWGSILTEAPCDWGRRIEEYSYDHRDLSDTRYLAVALVRKLEMDDRRKPVSARLFVRVVELPSGQVVCEGTLVPALLGRGVRVSALELDLLLPLCQVGGDKLCEAVADRKLR